ncbi:MAG TPA: F0F1 ATP synthase subunit A [Terriglobia bacterium]|nr:F0F1 ATP synthase subunit A [Terriglobia bacterium]
MEEQLAIVKWVNDVLGGPVASLLHLHPGPNEMVIPTHVIMETIVVLGLIVFFGILKTRYSVENPGSLQQAFELFVQFVQEQLEDTIGHDGQKYLGIIGTLALFIVCCNLLGLIPGLASPSGNSVNVPAGCAIVVFIYYHFQGVKKQGLVHYLKHFMGPVWWLAPLMVPIELISHFARPATLTIRLFANIMAEELVITIFFTLVSFLVPIPFMAFAIFGGLLQAFIFCTLAMVYLGGAVATEEHH